VVCFIHNQHEFYRDVLVLTSHVGASVLEIVHLHMLQKCIVGNLFVCQEEVGDQFRAFYAVRTQCVDLVLTSELNAFISNVNSLILSSNFHTALRMVSTVASVSTYVLLMISFGKRTPFSIAADSILLWVHIHHVIGRGIEWITEEHVMHKGVLAVLVL
jgi:hypothetical protein